MTNDIYEQLAEALDRLPNGFPRTPSNVEIQLLKKLFSPKEASIAIQLCEDMETVDSIAERIGLPIKEAMTMLLNMAKRGLVWSDKQAGKLQFRLAPFIVGIFEFQLDYMDHELAHLIDHYMADGGAAGIMRPHPAVHRVVPAQNAVKTEWILPYDDVRKILLAAKTIRVEDCICRVQMAHIGRTCNFPLRTCLNYSLKERPPSPHSISQEEALDILDQVEEVGLVHTVSNIQKIQTGALWTYEVGYICNCCGCCCAILRGINEWGIENSIAAANYYAVIDPDECTGCGICIERCQVHAISEKDGVTIVERERCIGCGLCVTGCPNDSAKLQRKPDAEIVHPPADFATWEHERRGNRGLIE